VGSTLDVREDEAMSVESTRAAMGRYWDDDDLSVVADDAVYTLTHSGREIRGRDAVKRLLEDFYTHAFEARFNIANRIIDDGRAVLEGRFMGRHVGDFEGIAATNREIDVPICVVYELENDQIKRVRVFLQVAVLREQLGVAGASERVAAR
jgi:steroid delta-isomerase-like uncharacterized protein